MKILILMLKKNFSFAEFIVNQKPKNPMEWGGGWGAVYKPSICGVGHVFLCLSMYVLVWIFTSFETHFLQICFLLHTLMERGAQH